MGYRMWGLMLGQTLTLAKIGCSDTTTSSVMYYCSLVYTSFYRLKKITSLSGDSRLETEILTYSFVVFIEYQSSVKATTDENFCNLPLVQHPMVWEIDLPAHI